MTDSFHDSINAQSVLETFIAYTGRSSRDNKWDIGLLGQVEEAMTQLLNPDGLVYNYDNAGQHTSLDRTYRNDIRRAMWEAGFVGE